MNRYCHVNILIRCVSSSRMVTRWASAANVVGNLVLLERLLSEPMFSSLSSPPPHLTYHVLRLFQTVFGAVSRMMRRNPSSACIPFLQRLQRVPWHVSLPGRFKGYFCCIVAHLIHAVNKWMKQVTRSQCQHFCQNLVKEEETHAVAAAFQRDTAHRELRRHLSGDVLGGEAAMTEDCQRKPLCLPTAIPFSRNLLSIGKSLPCAQGMNRANRESSARNLLT